MSPLRLLLVFSLLAAPLAAQEEKTPSAEDLFQQGRKALFQSNYPEAIKLLRQAVDADKGGEKTGYRLHLARAYRYAKQPKDSENLLVELLKKTPDHVEAGQLLAEIYYTQDRWEDISKVLKPLLKYRHDYPTYHLLAEATYNLEKYEDSRKYYKEAVKLNPQSGPDHYQLGNIYLAENRFASAADSYETAMRLGVEGAILNYKLASAYFNLRNYFGRVAAVTVKAGKAGEINGDWYLIEPIPGKKDQFRAASRKSAIYQIAAAIAGGMEERPDIQLLQANTYLNARRYQQAYEKYQQLGEKIPPENHALYQYYFAQSALGLRKYDEYLAHLQEAVKLDPDSYDATLIDAYLTVADKYNQAGDLEKYIQYLELAMKQAPQNAAMHRKLGDAYEESRKYDKAVEQWRMVLDLEPDHPQRTALLNLIKKHQ